MAYSTDSDLEVYVPDVLNLGLPEPVENGLITKLDGDFAAGVTTLIFQDIVGMALGEFFRIGTGSNTEIVAIAGTVAGLGNEKKRTVAATRKVHKTNSRVEQVLENGFSADHALAKTDIDKQLDIRWFRGQIGNKFNLPAIFQSHIVFDPTLMLNASTELKTLSVYWVLGYYVFPKLQRKKPTEDYYTNQAKEFRERAEAELNIILAQGISYDWDESGLIGLYEESQPSMGFVVRRA